MKASNHYAISTEMGCWQSRTSQDCINVVFILDGPHSSYPRTWSRSASNLGSGVDADVLSAKLAQEWPPSEYPVHIQVVGKAAGEGISVRVWNSRGIKESEIVYPEDHAPCEDPIAVAVVEELECIVNRLLIEGKLQKKAH